MKNLKKTLFILLLGSTLSTNVFAGPLLDLSSFAEAAAQYAQELVSKERAKDKKKDVTDEKKNYKGTSAKKKENIPVTPITSDDLKPYTDETYPAEIIRHLSGTKLNAAQLQGIIKSTYLLDHSVEGGLASVDELDLGADEVTIDPMENAKRTNTIDFMGHKRFVSIHRALALAEKTLNGAGNQESEIEALVKDINHRTDLTSLERGIGLLDQKIAQVLNEILALESARLEINSTLLMQNRQLDSVAAK